MAGSPSGTERLGIRAIRNDGLRLSGCMENTGVVLETLPHHPTIVQREHHYHPLGTTQRERHEKLHPDRAPALRLGWLGEPAAAIARGGGSLVADCFQKNGLLRSEIP